MSPGLGERCGACGSTTTLSVISHTVPRIEIKSLDMIPFSESFSGLFDEDNDEDDESHESDDEKSVDHEEYQTRNEMSYNVEQFSNVRDLDPEWDDEDVAEVMVLSPKERYSKLPTISEEYDVVFAAPNEAHGSRTLPQEKPSVTLADFDIIPTSGYPMLCRKRSTEKVYVIRTLDRWNSCEERVIMEVIRAIRAPFLERIHWSLPGVAVGEEEKTYLVSESHAGNLIALMGSRPIAPADALFYVCEVVEGVSSLHAANIIHRDLTPSNIFIDHKGHIILSNFCNAAFLAANKQCSTPPSAAIEYQAPEILLGWAHDFAVDCWSLGVLLHFLLTGTNPVVDADGDNSVRSRILSEDVAMNDALPSPEAKDLIERCLERNPVLRASIGAIREHDYFTNVDWNGVARKTISLPTSTTPPKLRPSSQDFPLPPGSRLSHNLDTSLDIPFTFHTASKAVSSQPHLELLRGPETPSDTHKPFRSSSMDDLRIRNKLQRLSLNIPSSLASTRRNVRDAGTSSAWRADTSSACPTPPPCPPLRHSLSLQIQTPDSLPKIFRSTVLDDRLFEEEEPSQPSPTISSPTVCALTPRERMSQFWERLDAEEGQESDSSVPSLELRDALKLALPCPPLPVPRSRRLRKQASSSAFPQSQSEQRFSILSTTTTNKLRKLRRPLSTPLMSKRSEPVLNLPSGVVQIGKGIGFTYKMPVASHSKASICTTGAPSAASKLLRSGLGLLRKAKSHPKFSSAAVPGRRTRGPPAMIQTSLGFTSVSAPLGSPASDGPLTPDSLTFPLLPEIVGDPFAKDGMGGPDVTLRLVSASPSEYRLPFSPTVQPLDNFIFSRVSFCISA